MHEHRKPKHRVQGILGARNRKDLHTLQELRHSTVHPGDIMLKFRTVARIENHTENHTENHRRLSRLQREILVKVQEDPSYTRSQLASMIDNASLGGVISALSRLQELGIIRRVGPDKGGHWELLQQS